MTLKILKLPQAERDIEECFVHIDEDNLEIGLKFLDAFEKSVEQLAEFPFLGKALELKNDEFREMRIWHVTGYDVYLIFYIPSQQAIEIVRVLHAARDIGNLLS